MKAEIKTMEIKSIEFESNDTEVVVAGKVNRGHMSFDTEIIIGHSQLNQLINLLTRNNQGFNINDILQSEPMYEEGFMYSAKFPTSMNRLIDMDNIFQNQSVRQIRA